MSANTTTEATAAPVPPTRHREEVFSKEDLVASLTETLGKVLGERVSKAKAWDVFKTCQNTAFELAAQKPLSLAGVGRFYTFDSQRSVQAGKPAKRIRFRPSSRVNEQLNAGTSFLAEAPEVPTEAAPVGAVSPTEAEKAPALSAVPEL